MRLSVVIITFNEEKNIGRCIDSVLKVADEIIVVDSCSTDKTAEIASSKGAQVKLQPFLGYVEQKNMALEAAANDYVLSLDADEALDKVLECAILEEKKNFTYKGYSMNRCTSYCGKFIRRGSWYPDRKLRLIDKRYSFWGGDNPHDKLVLKDHSGVKHLKGDILHYSYNSIEEHIQQNNKFSTISAETYFTKGKKTSLFKMILHPLWAFILGYIFRGGFLDGFYGFVIALHVAHLSFLKHAKLYHKQKLSHQ
ncbi:MAG TPA: glycosyltransferase family 2 protein [Flavitalea sp.]|nr:glycosyltransferase family 2 protein [Flavitalea sp.]